MTDILFVIDNSGSMDTAQASLIDNFPAFIGWAASTNADYHIGVIATEVNDAESGLGSPPRDILPGVLVQAPGRPRILTNVTPDLDAAFADNANLGNCCSDEQEAGLQAAWMALSAPLADDPGANAGFVREAARLYIIFLSNEQDQSPGAPEDYFQAFGSIKGANTPVLTRVSAIVGDPPGGCGNDAGGGGRYVEVADWSGGLFISICTDDWAQALSDLGADAFSYRAAFVLSRPADDDTLVVTVDGQSVSRCAVPGCPDGWTYYPDINTLEFGADVAPAAGEQVEVVFTAMCL